MSIGQRLILSGILSFLTIVSGIWISCLGRPYNTVLFTIHKLIALAAVIFTVVLIVQLLKNIDIDAVLLLLLIVAVLSIIALFASGALLSIGKAPHILLRTIHAVSSISAVVTPVIALYLLMSKK